MAWRTKSIVPHFFSISPNAASRLASSVTSQGINMSQPRDSVRGTTRLRKASP